MSAESEADEASKPARTTPPPRRPKSKGGRGKKRTDWQDRFITAFAETGIVVDAAKAVGVGRSLVYAERDRNPDFKARWDAIEEWTTEELEQVAKRRARDGSDLLMIFLLKARRPAIYRENVKIEHGGKVSHEIEEGINEKIGALLGEIDRLRDRLAEVEPVREAAPSGAAPG